MTVSAFPEEALSVVVSHLIVGLCVNGYAEGALSIVARDLPGKALLNLNSSGWW